MELVEYDSSYWNFIQDYQVTNADYTGIPKEVIETPPQDKLLMGIDKEIIRTFFVLDTGDAKFVYGGDVASLLLRSFSTDSRYLRQGFARKTIELLVEFILREFPDISQFVLGVNVKNRDAIAFYHSVGFSDSGKRVVGKLGEQMVLQLELK